jgi:hypothetical protein
VEVPELELGTGGKLDWQFGTPTQATGAKAARRIRTPWLGTPGTIESRAGKKLARSPSDPSSPLCSAPSTPTPIAALAVAPKSAAMPTFASPFHARRA